jgi:hypothetical protein
VKPARIVRSAFLLAAAVTAGAFVLQWLWAGWSPYAGAGPPLALRWLLTCCLGAALLLPPSAALTGAAAARRLTDTGLLDQLRLSRWSSGRLALMVGVQSLAPLGLALMVSAVGWLAVARLDRSALVSLPGSEDRSAAMAIAVAHVLVAVITGAFGLWGAALAAGRRRPGAGHWGGARRLGTWGALALVVVTLGPWLVGPVLPRLSHPELALDAVLLLNPGTAVGAALGVDVLRSPRLYLLTRAPEYWYTYPPALAVTNAYALLALVAAARLRARLGMD